MLKKLNWIFSPQLLPVLRNVSGIVTLGKIEISIRVVKRSSDLRTSNFKFEFVFVFQPFDNRIQASLIRRRQFCLESGGCYFSGLHHHHRQPWAQCPLVSDAILTIAAHRCLSRAAWLNSCRVVPHHCSMSSDHSR